RIAGPATRSTAARQRDSGISLKPENTCPSLNTPTPDDCYSYLRATTGSTHAALRAGTTLAIKATIARTADMGKKVKASVELTPYKTLESSRVAANDPDSPRITPAAVNNADCPSTCLIMLPSPAPSAILTPIS